MGAVKVVEQGEPGEAWERSMGFLLHDVARLMRKRFEQHARSQTLALTRSQASVLGHLARQEGINQVTLAQLMELEPITLVRLLDRLQDAGLIERRADPQDRRARVLYLTPQARPLLDRVGALARDVYDEALAGLSKPERERLVDTLVAMKANLTDRMIVSPENPVEASHD
jgi:DNA-binding MarR family transcriptional regulator